MKSQSVFKPDLPNSENLNKTNKKYSNKKYLENIEKNFSLNHLVDKPSSNFSFYPYANDIQHLPFGDYLSKIDAASRLKFFSKEQQDNNRNIGLVVGNGYILSLLPDLSVSDIILIDIEPAVHHFILFIKDLILDTKENDFSKKRDEIKLKINQYCQKIKTYRLLTEEDTLESEMDALGSRHFLFSEERFNQCKKALIEKDLLPIKLNILDYKSVNKFAAIIRKEGLEISFINVTNVGDYDRFRILYHNLICLPLAKDFAVVSTSLISSSNRDNEFPQACLLAENLEQLEQNLIYNYRRNTNFG